MRKNISYLCLAMAVVCCAGCAKKVSEGLNDANKRFFDAWTSVHVPDAEKYGRGIYILETQSPEEDRHTVTEDGFVIMRYTTTDLDGNITSYTDMSVAEQLGKYDPTEYYGPQVLNTTPETIRAGVLDGIRGLKVGSSRTFIVPSWLMSYKNFGTEEEFLAQESEYSNTVYKVEIEDFTTDINNWQFSRIIRTVNSKDFYDGIFGNGTTTRTTVEDSTAFGLYFKDIARIASKKEFPSDTTVYINYTGRLLNGLVFDTTIEKVAKDNNLYSSTKEYEPAKVDWGEKYTDITLNGSSVIGGFARTLWEMANTAPGTKSVGVFYSGLGYGHSGSGSIPAYAPLVFEIEMVKNPED